MYSAKGILLRKYNVRDADRVYIAYTEKFGKKQLIATGVRKIKGKLGGHLQEFAEIDLEFVKGKRQEKITGAEISRNFKNIRGDLKKIVICNFILDLTDNMVKWDYPDKAVYDLLVRALEIIDGQKNIKEAHLTAYVFVWKLLAASGYHPLLNECAECRKDISEGGYFYEIKGGFICENCAPGKNALFAVSGKSLECLKNLRLDKINLNKDALLIIKKIMRIHLDKVLKSEVWMEKLFGNLTYRNSDISPFLKGDFSEVGTGVLA